MSDGHCALTVPELTTARLRLRLFRESDFEDYAAMMADADVAQFLGAGPLTRTDAWRQLAMFIGWVPSPRRRSSSSGRRQLYIGIRLPNGSALTAPRARDLHAIDRGQLGAGGVSAPLGATP